MIVLYVKKSGDLLLDQHKCSIVHIHIGWGSLHSKFSVPSVNLREITWKPKPLFTPPNHCSRQTGHRWSQRRRKHALCNADGRPKEGRQALSILLLDKEMYTLNGEVPCILRLVPPSASQCQIYSKSDISMIFTYLTAFQLYGVVSTATSIAD